MKKGTETLCWEIWLFGKTWDFGYCRCFRIEKVLRAISRMARRKRPGPNEIRWNFGKTRTKREDAMNGGGVQWFRCIKTRVISKTVTTTGVSNC
ncbi:hypothetical protein H5410_062957 [Solanum commersonii]|uniref:Uncharacterized protein n=1 Tax=Solanum commersonii TaxID=4109 RepID=A0A9J5WCZ5_SOLCO|nr:hypothetical protein H5410_062957 [Solanum commersonii]